MIKNVQWSSRVVPVNFVRLKKKLEFSRQIFEKHSNIKFHDNPSSEGGGELFQADRRTDRHDET
jgi:hypothetical protein